MLVTLLKFQIVVIQNLDHISRRYLTKLLRNMCFAFIYIGIKTPIDAKKFDRQRTEIKVYDKSPDWLKAIEQSKFVYKWKFRLDQKFQPSPHFTHLFQMKAVGGSSSSHPMITFSARKGRRERPEKFELRYGTQHKSKKFGGPIATFFR